MPISNELRLSLQTYAKSINLRIYAFKAILQKAIKIKQSIKSEFSLRRM